MQGLNIQNNLINTSQRNKCTLLCHDIFSYKTYKIYYVIMAVINIGVFIGSAILSILKNNNTYVVLGVWILLTPLWYLFMYIIHHKKLDMNSILQLISSIMINGIIEFTKITLSVLLLKSNPDNISNIYIILVIYNIVSIIQYIYHVLYQGVNLLTCNNYAEL